MTIESLRIVGIFDRTDIEFNFRRSPFFLVGPNGTGKSTALRIVHNILTAQYSKLSDLPFSSVEIILNGEQQAALDRDAFAKIDRVRNLIVARTRRRVRSPRTMPLSWEAAKRLLTNPEVSPPSISRLARKISDETISDFEEDYEAIALISNFVEAETRGRVLYFPTYRRVERDLHELLEQDEDDDPFEDKPIGPKIADRFKSAGEVVGFGGQDIRALLGTTATRIDVQARQALNEHSVRFLEVLSTDQKGETPRARNLVKSEAKTERLLRRLSSFSATNLDIASIRQSIENLRNKITKVKPGRVTQQQEMLLFYVAELIQLIDKIDELSAPLIHFSKLINDYLRPVKRSFLRESDNRLVILDKSENEIELDQLSSGEKQIIAFFAFIILTGALAPKYIFIDEPELSLSVSWQKSLISDIISAGPAVYIAAATHSPFIFERFGLPHVVSLGDL